MDWINEIINTRYFSLLIAYGVISKHTPSFYNIKIVQMLALLNESVAIET